MRSRKPAIIALVIGLAIGLLWSWPGAIAYIIGFLVGAFGTVYNALYERRKKEELRQKVFG